MAFYLLRLKLQHQSATFFQNRIKSLIYFKIAKLIKIGSFSKN